MNNFSELVTSSVLTRFLALVILGLAMIAAIAVAAFDYMTARTVPTEIVNILYFGLGAALSVLGINFGVVLTPAKKEEPTNGVTHP